MPSCFAPNKRRSKGRRIPLSELTEDANQGHARVVRERGVYAALCDGGRNEISAEVRYQKRCHEQEEQRHADPYRHSAFALNFQHELRPKSKSRQES